MISRHSSRLLILNSSKCVLLFRFAHKSGPLAGQVFWATPGGAVDAGESFEDAAKRELMEEVGVAVDSVGAQIAQRTAIFTAPSGELVEADERYYLVHVSTDAVSNENWTALEREVMAAHQWWSQRDLRAAGEQVWPEDLERLLISLGEWASEPL